MPDDVRVHFDSPHSIDDCCRSAASPAEDFEPTIEMRWPAYPPMTIEETVEFGANVDRVYVPGFRIREPDGTLRAISNREMHAHTQYLKVRDETDRVVQRWVEEFEAWAADGCPVHI